jgi:hypothetical protein
MFESIDRGVLTRPNVLKETHVGCEAEVVVYRKWFSED